MSAHMLQAVFTFVQENGKFDDRYLADSSDSKHWILDGIEVYQEGNVKGIVTPTMKVTQTFDQPLMYWKGSEFELVRIAQKLVPEQFPHYFR